MLKDAITRCPLIAILRGLRPEEAESIGMALVNAGISIIEVPLNSPEPLESIRRLACSFGEKALIGAGTVTRVEDVARLCEAGGKLMVAPNMDVRVISAAKAAGLIAIPGVATPTEAFLALEAGADGLKLFPAETLGPISLQAWRAVLPVDSLLIPVGGVDETTIADWHKAGASAFGIGSALFKPGATAEDVTKRTRRLLATLPKRDFSISM